VGQRGVAWRDAERTLSNCCSRDYRYSFGRGKPLDFETAKQTTETMRITFITPTLNDSGGVKVVLIYAEELTRLGHSVTIVSQPRAAPSLRDQLRSLKNGDGWLSSPPIAIPDGVLNLVLDCHRPTVDGDVPDGDVVIATWWETAEWVSKLSPSKGRQIYFVQGHEVYPPIPARAHDSYTLPMKKIVVSKWLQKIMESNYLASSVAIVPNTVDRYKFFAPQREKQPRPTLGLLYSTSFPKGLDASLRAIELIQRKMVDLRVVAFGSQPQARSHPLPRGSSYTRLPSIKRLRSIYSQCDVWLTASRSDGFNLTALEAMACRAPVVSTKVGWPAEGISNGLNGFLCDVDNTEELADSAIQILRLPTKQWRLMSEYAYQTLAPTESWAASAKLFAEEIGVRTP
jgi:glycosyltransferase involved in cell wall biosynthesis